MEQYSFSDQAAQSVVQDQSMLVYQDNIEGVWDDVLERGTYGIIPFENSSAGVVWPHLDRLSRESIEIIGEAEHKVRMAVGGVLGTDLQKVQRAYSHPKALEQSGRYLRGLPSLHTREETKTTVAGIRTVQELNDVHSIALGSRLAIEAAGLQVLADDVADLPGDKNITQFYVVHKNGSSKLPNVDSLHHAAIVTPHNKRGVLHRILSIADNARVDLSSLHSRSIGLKEYSFYLEMTRQGKPDEFDLMAKQLNSHPDIRSVKWLGSWNNRVES